ncbi:MAG: FlgD immunoglobulin-like domain containing protein [bacterium]
MSIRDSFIGRSLTLLTLTCVLCCVMNSAAIGQKNLKQPLANSQFGDNTLNDKLELVKLQREFLNRIQAKLEGMRQNEVVRDRIRQYPVSKKIGAFLEALDKAERNGHRTEDILQSFLSQRKALLGNRASSGISGILTSDDQNSSSDPIEVFAFDRYGFLANVAGVESSGRYALTDLPGGDYYVVARRSFRNTWKISERVSVAHDREVADMHFDFTTDVKTGFDGRLQKDGGLRIDDASITGTVTGPGGAPLTLAFIFAFDMADTSSAGLALSEVGTGNYSVDSLAAGDFIVYADSYLNISLDIGFGITIEAIPLRGEYYDNAATPDLATTLTLTASQTLADIDFSLEPGGAISGHISDETGAPLDSMFLIAAKLDLENPSAFFTEAIDISMGFSDTQGDYTLSGFSSGDYILRTISFINPDLLALIDGKLGKHAGLVVDEYSGDVQHIFRFDEAERIPVSEPDTTSGIDFVLDLAGGISGSFTELTDGSPVQGEGTVVAFNADTGLPELALDFDTLATTYEIRPLPQGNYKLLGTVSSPDIAYLPQFYNLKDFATADPVTVTPPGTTPDINFTMLRAGAISGVVTVPAAGSNTTFASVDPDLEITVLAYDRTTGELAGGMDADSLTHEFTITGLTQGVYNIVAMPAAQGLAATYHGGGTTFDHANSAPVNVTFGATSTADITLAVGEGIISGRISDDKGNPLAGVVVIAYDTTGHAISAGLSGIDITTGEINPNSGDFFIPGLVSGDYFVRTFSFFRLLALPGELGLGGDPLTLILGILTGQTDLGSLLDTQIFADFWYPDQIIEIDLARLDLLSLIFDVFLGDGDPFAALLPFFDSVPTGATTVAVTSPGQKTGIDFILPAIDLGDVLTDVEEQPGTGLVPDDFGLSQNYPNPFNPETVIEYQVPNTAEIKLQVYNLLGQKIRTLFSGLRQAGSHTIQWDGLNDRGQQVAAGIYFLRLQADRFAVSKKMLLVR